MAIKSIVVEDNAGVHTERQLTTTPTELGLLAGVTATTAELNTTDGVTSAIQTQLDDKKSVPIFSRMQEFENDCWNIIPTPLNVTPIASGTLGIGAPEANHPGVVLFRSSTSANSGLAICGSSAAIALTGGEFLEFIFRVDIATNTVGLCGFHNGGATISPTRQTCFNITGTTLMGVCVDASGETDTGTTYSITQGVWYRAKVALNANATLVTFTLNTCADGVQVWTDTCASHIYTGAGQMQSLTWYTTATAAATILSSLDWFHFACSRVLVR